ncbi:glycosyltransferase family 2 protein [Empedobacter falsenii]|uniref:Glycosyltransferase family 2 protein n=1 Tax=Empedobacter falsenii TaxID=343874 RepID=A0A427BRK9_9FLAO|nr:glycosyltransferase family 2 protein [Empedobacter falsenii]RRT93466.1 glycosyltransferase family 2 protein [Empedobacter falsenii]RRT93612.1 glycosyltransferase family 2 protein [Empedobacter falsenii]
MINKKVSILIPVYGVEKYISKCLDSVVNQTYKNIEVLFINDCTEDNSINIVEQYINSKNKNFDKITIIHNQTNIGLAATRNVGLKNATGDFIFHLDSDDYLELDAIESLITLQLQENADIVFSNLRFVYSNESTVVKKLKFISDKDEYLTNILFRSTGLNVVGNLYRKDLFEDVKFVEGLNFGEDYVTLPKLVFSSNKITFLEKPIYNYIKLNTNSYTSNINKKSILDIISAYENIHQFFIQNKTNKFIQINENAFYNLKAQIIKTTKGNKELLSEFKIKIQNYPIKYTKTNSNINNLVNFVFDLNLSVCGFFIKMLSN